MKDLLIIAPIVFVAFFLWINNTKIENHGN